MAGVTEVQRTHDRPRDCECHGSASRTFIVQADRENQILIQAEGCAREPSGGQQAPVDRNASCQAPILAQDEIQALYITHDECLSVAVRQLVRFRM